MDSVNWRQIFIYNQSVELNSKEILVWYAQSNVRALYLMHSMTCGLTVKRTRIVAASVRMLKAQTVKMEAPTENEGGESRTHW
jgi:hypothetical protein